MELDYDLIDEYLANRLNDEDLEALELEMLENVALQEAIITQRMLKRGLIIHSLASAKKLPPKKGTTEKKRLTASMAKLVGSPGWAYAASLLLAVSLGFNWLRFSGEKGVQIDRLIYLETTRGSVKPQYYINRLEKNLFIVDVDPNSSGPYRIIFSNQDSSQNNVVSSQKFARAANDSLKILVPDLPAGNYLLSIVDQQNVSTFNFNVQ